MRIVIFLFLVLPQVLAAQKDHAKLMHDYMEADHAVKEFNGAVAVYHKEKIIFQHALGWADREWDIPNSITTKFRIGSVTKQFTAACIMQLAEQGKLSVDDKLSVYFPNYPKADEVTIHMLLTHTSGIKNYTDMPAFWPKAVLPLPVDSMIALFRNAPYDFTPGSKWNYSNSGYYLLGAIIEKVSGQSYTKYLQQHIINLAGLKNTGIDRLDSILKQRAKGYMKTPKSWKQADIISMEAPYSAGAMFSTTNDLYRWMWLFTHNKILPAGAVKKMTTAYKSYYGYGFVVDSLKTHPRIWHNGGIPGFSAHLAYYPNDELYVVVLSNNSSNADRTGIALASLFFGMPVLKPYIPKEIRLDPALLDRYTGKYMGNSNIEIIRKNDKLYRHREGTPDIELKPETPTRFFYADLSDRFIEFEVNAEGVVQKLWFEGNGERYELRRR